MELNNINISPSCYGVKCMVEGCQNLSSHKIGEELDTEQSAMTHNLTSYVCEQHFNLVMDRDEQYKSYDSRFHTDSKYIRYELQERKYSANCIKGIYIHVDEKGKQHEKFDLVIISCLNKVQGDIYADTVMKFLNSLLSDSI